MGGTTGHGSYQPGNMDITQHKQTWEGFTKLVFWGSIVVVAILVLLAIFRTN